MRNNLLKIVEENSRVAGVGRWVDRYEKKIFNRRDGVGNGGDGGVSVSVGVETYGWIRVD